MQNLKKRVKLGIFFSHPTPHHAPMFRFLSMDPTLNVKVFYYDSLFGMQDRGFGQSAIWDVDLTSGIDSVVLKNLLRGSSINTFRQVNPGVAKAMVEYMFDAVYVSGYITPSNWLVLLLAKLTKSKILYQSDTNILNEKRKTRSAFQRLIRQIFLKSVDTLLVVGDKNKEFYLSCGLREKQMTWCPIPVDVERFQSSDEDMPLIDLRLWLRTTYDMPATAKVVVLSGKLIERKRPQDLILAVKHLKRNDVYALFIGTGTLEDRLKSMIQPTDNIRFAGFVNQKMMPSIIKAADIGVVTSEWDPHPLVITEFAACGLPVIASHFAGVWGDHDILRPNENGLVYKCGDIQALASSIAKILDNELLRQRMSNRSLELAQEQSARHAAKIIANHLLQSN